MKLRQRVLHAAFGLLYGPLAACHEMIGRMLFGAAWDGRRQPLLNERPNHGLLVDLGCGEGLLLSAHAPRIGQAVGIEPSGRMARRARRRGVTVIQATAQRLPFATASVGLVVCSYPGPWFFDAQTWQEIERVSLPGARICELLGGTVERGSMASVRAFVLRLAYGHGDDADPQILSTGAITGDYERRSDAWGEAIYWFGVRS